MHMGTLPQSKAGLTLPVTLACRALQTRVGSRAPPRQLSPP